MFHFFLFTSGLVLALASNHASTEKHYPLIGMVANAIFLIVLFCYNPYGFGALVVGFNVAFDTQMLMRLLCKK